MTTEDKEKKMEQAAEYINKAYDILHDLDLHDCANGLMMVLEEMAEGEQE